MTGGISAESKGNTPRPAISATKAGPEESDDLEASKPSANASSLRGQAGRLYLLTALAAISYFLFGYGSGIIAGSMLLVRKDFYITDPWHGLIVSVMVGAAWLGALLAGPTVDRLGRKSAILIASVSYLLGSITMAAAGIKEELLVGRLLFGLGIGLSSVAGPIYVSESSPASIRGILVTASTCCGTFGILVAGVTSAAFSTTDGGWRWSLGLGAVPAAVQLVGFAFMPMSPRFLVRTGRAEQAEQVLRTIRGRSANISAEIAAIQKDVRTQEKLFQLSSGHQSSTLVQVLHRSATRRALLVGCLLQLFQQISGVNAVVYYSASIISLAGVKDTSKAIWLSSTVYLFSFIFKIAGLGFVERVGRRKLLLWSTFGSMVALLVLGVGFQLMASSSPGVDVMGPDASCATWSTCYDCQSGGTCGFCFRDLPDGPVEGSCLPVMSKYNSSAKIGRCANATVLGINSLTWAPSWCPTDYAWIPTAGMLLYMSCFSPGLGGMPWTITSEMFPLWARSTCNSITTAVNWGFNIIVSLTFLPLTDALTRQGTFFMYAGLTGLGLAVFYMMVPETKGVALEEMEELFSNRWGFSAPRLNGVSSSKKEYGAMDAA